MVVVHSSAITAVTTRRGRIGGTINVALVQVAAFVHVLQSLAPGLDVIKQQNKSNAASDK